AYGVNCVCLYSMSTCSCISCVSFCLHCCVDHPHLHSFPTRRSSDLPGFLDETRDVRRQADADAAAAICVTIRKVASRLTCISPRSEEHTSELQSQSNLVCRLLLEKKKNAKPSAIKRRTADPPHNPST